MRKDKLFYSKRYQNFILRISFQDSRASLKRFNFDFSFNFVLDEKKKKNMKIKQNIKILLPIKPTSINIIAYGTKRESGH